jgi:hypothetical protein
MHFEVALARAVLFVVLIICGVSVKCATTGGGTPVPVPTNDGGSVASGLEHCASDAVTKAASNVLGEVANDLLTEGYAGAFKDEEAKLAAQGVAAATDVVLCAVELFVGSNTRKAAYDPLMSDQLRRARTYLAAAKK